MIAFSTFLGRACVDDALRGQIRTALTYFQTGSPDTNFNTTTSNMSTLVLNLGLRASLFEIWELVRVFSPNPKGWINPKMTPDTRIDAWMTRIQQANQAAGLQPPQQPNEVFEIIGVAAVDSLFMSQLQEAISAGATPFDNFLSTYNFTISSKDNPAAIQYLQNVFGSKDMVAGIKMFRDPQGTPITAGETRCWDPPCEPNRAFTTDYNTSHPWGFPGKWRVPNQS